LLKQHGDVTDLTVVDDYPVPTADAGHVVIRVGGGVYAILPAGRLAPAKTRLFVDEVAKAIKAGWTR
ncbi:hypothetical protein ACIKTA_14650, partial [Hansschlegelia beijingensis]